MTFLFLPDASYPLFLQRFCTAWLALVICFFYGDLAYLYYLPAVVVLCWRQQPVLLACSVHILGFERQSGVRSLQRRATGARRLLHFRLYGRSSAAPALRMTATFCCRTFSSVCLTAWLHGSFLVSSHALILRRLACFHACLGRAVGGLSRSSCPYCGLTALFSLASLQFSVASLGSRRVGPWFCCAIYSGNMPLSAYQRSCTGKQAATSPSTVRRLVRTACRRLGQYDAVRRRHSGLFGWFAAWTFLVSSSSFDRGR